MNSRSGSQWVRSCEAYCRAMLAGSAKPTRAITTPERSRPIVADQGRSSEGSGMPLGSSPTTARSSPPTLTSSSAPTVPIRAPGISGLTRLARTATASTVSPTAMPSQLQAAGWVSASKAARRGLVELPLAPTSEGTWELAISTAAARVNAATTGWLIR